MTINKEMEVETMLKQLMIKDLRIQARQRGVSPAGGIEELRSRIAEHMVQTGDYQLRAEDGSLIGTHSQQGAAKPINNYTRPEGQNVGNFLTDRNSSRVLAPPGGGSQISFGDQHQTPVKRQVDQPHQVSQLAPKPPAPTSANPASQPPIPTQAGNIGQQSQAAQFGNNYSRPMGQNVGNFLTDRTSSRVNAPPGGKSQVSLG